MTWISTSRPRSRVKPPKPFAIPWTTYVVMNTVSTAAGLLLANLLAAHPSSVPSPRRSDEVFAMTRTVVTLLAAWRTALSPSTFQLHVDDQQSRQWTSYLENVAEDPSIAVPFLDSFTGLEPAWQYPLMIGERPAMRSAIDKLRSSGR